MYRYKARYNLREIEDRLDIKRGRLREWANNKYIRGVQGEYRGRRIEQYTLIDAYQIAFFRYLVEDCKLSRDEAGLWVNQWRDLFDKQEAVRKRLKQIEQGSKFRSMPFHYSNSIVAFVRKVDDLTIVMFDRDEIEDAQKKTDWKMMLVVNVYKISKNIDRLLNIYDEG